MTSPIINPAALEPLYAPHEEPNFHRVRAETAGQPAKVVKSRRPSSIVIANNLRSFVKDWRETDYAGGLGYHPGAVYTIGLSGTIFLRILPENAFLLNIIFVNGRLLKLLFIFTKSGD